MSSFKSSKNNQKKEVGSDRSVSDNQFSSVTLNELAMKARKSYCNFKFHQRSHTMTLEFSTDTNKTNIKPDYIKNFYQIFLFKGIGLQRLSLNSEDGGWRD